MLSILIQKPQDLTLSNIFIGYYNAFGELGHKVNWLKDESVFDKFYETRPDLVITETSLLNKAVVKSCIKYKPTIALYLAKEAHLTEESIEHVRQLLSHETSSDLSKSRIFPFVIKNNILTKTSPWQRWLGIGLFPEIVKPAADTIRFKQGNYRPEFACDMVYIGTWKPQKENLLRYFEWCYSRGENVRIYGYGNWNHPLHVGAVSDKDYMDVLASSKTVHANDSIPSEKYYRYKLANVLYRTHDFQPGSDCGGSSGNTGCMDDDEYKEFLGKESYLARVKDILKCVNLA